LAKPEWGAKRICHNCGARFYDMQRDPIVCPKCHTVFDPEALLRSRRTRPAAVADIGTTKAAAKGKAKPAVVRDEEDVGEVEEQRELETSEDEDVLEDEPSLDKVESDEGEFTEGDVEERDDSDVLLEDASELGDESVDDVIGVDNEEDESR
jgi:uncharacterized protein (TIGR02300 family)